MNRRKIFLGSTLFRPAHLRSLSGVSGGFRRLRSGAEGLLKLVQNGTRRGGRIDPEGLRLKRIPELLVEDWPGVEEAAHLFRRAEPAVLRAAGAVVDGGWDRAAMLRTEAWCLARASLEPDAVLARAQFPVNKKKCPVLRSVFESKRLVGPDTRSWLETVARTHQILT